MDFYFHNIRLIDPVEKIDDFFNVRIKDGIFAQISKSECDLDLETRKIDGINLIMTPGFIDIHVHLREPGQEHKETIKTGTASAANGGFTGVVCMPNTKPDIDNVEVIDYINSKSRDLLVDVFISAGITKGRKGDQLTDMNELSEAGVLLFTDDGAPVSNSNVMKQAFEYAAYKDLILSQHCEDTELTGNFVMNESELSTTLGLEGYPRIAEEIILFRDIRMADYYGNRKYHAQHLSTIGAIDLVRYAKSNNQRVSCEVTPHHFVLTEENMRQYNADYKMNPPLRQQIDVDGIIEGIKDGTVDCIATDHAPHSEVEKNNELQKAPNGIIGLETALGLSMTYLVHAGHISVNRMIEMLTNNPREILGIAQPKIKTGEIANVTIFNPDEEWTVDKKKFKSKSSNSPFEGFKLKGKPVMSINKNQYFECDL
ncbi:MAG: dihydroorotase [Candidatus Kapabacteria bacterium]|nr:dihydroorotase [Ignavibacteriota bacterium]MCW5883574.1 dihydroorotase [Candidatus Kapabacteria bacterium]